MRWVKRFLPAVLAVSVLVVGTLVVVSHAQTSDQGPFTGANLSSSTAPSVVTTSNFLADANSICLTMVNQLSAGSQAFQQQVQNAAKVQPDNQVYPANTPLMGTTTTSPGALTPSGTGSSLTTSPSGSYDTSPVQTNPLTIVNQLLNEYMDQLDAIVGMQNDVLDQLENLSEPADSEPLLQQIWVSMTGAMVAQNQADVVLENMILDYYNAGLYAQDNALNGLTPADIPGSELKQTTAETFSQDLSEFPTLEANLNKIAGPVDGQLGTFGLNECEVAGIAYQDYQTLGQSIPNVGNDYLNTYVGQSAAKSAISLAQVLNLLPAPLGQSLIFGGGSTASSGSTTTTLAVVTLPTEPS